MPMWELLVDAFGSVLVVLTHALGGSLGSAIVVTSLAVRLLLLPLTVRVALRARALQRRMKELEPELARLRARHASDPRRLAEQLQAFHRRHDLPMVPRGTFSLAAVQVPLGGALYQALTGGLGAGHRFLWLADLARPDALLAGAAATLAMGAAAAGASAGGASGGMASHAAVLASGVVTLVVVWRLASGVGLYWAASSAVGVLQGVIVRRIDARVVARTATA